MRRIVLSCVVAVMLFSILTGCSPYPPISDGGAIQPPTSDFTESSTETPIIPTETTQPDDIESSTDATLNSEPNMEVPHCEIELEQTTLTLYVGESVCLTPYIVTEAVGITWNTSDKNIATIEDGLITAIGVGECTVSITCQHGCVEARCDITIVEPIPEKEFLIVIDAGHQSKGNYNKEPLGPGSSEMKNKVSSGTEGISTGLPEYELNLQVALKLQKALIEAGYDVLMIRTTNNVDISNAERAAVANDAHADAFLRIHADGSDDSSRTGAMTICMTKNNPYNANIHTESLSLSQFIIDGICEETGAKNRGVWETDTMTGINWSEVPVTIIEMGFMTNPNEDKLMSSSDYQDKIVSGIINGLDLYFEQLQ